MIYLDAESVSVKVARDYVGKIAAESWPVDEYTVRVVTSELVTNAVRYGGTHKIRVDAYADGDRYVVGVWDASGTLPVIRRPAAGSLCGRGLLLVAELATRWGVLPDHEEGGKTVYAEWTVA